MSSTRTAFSLSQKIFIVKSFYRNDESLAEVRKEFQKKYSIRAGDTIFRSLTTVLRSFETTGSVSQTLFFDVVEGASPNPPQEIVEGAELEPEVEVITELEPEPGARPSNPPDTTADRLSVCTFCSKGFRQGDSTSDPPQSETIPSDTDPVGSLRTYFADRPFPCTFCDKSFKQKGALKVHLRRHTGESPFVCTVCSRGFKQSVNLICHMKSFHPEEDPSGHTNRPFPCTFCDKRFKQKAALKVHLRRHTGESPFVCSLCPKAFKQKINLMCHTKSAHPNATTPRGNASS